jgi:hypothetical protein
MTIGRWTLTVAGLSMVCALWTVAVFWVDSWPRTRLDIVTYVGTPILCLVGLVVGAIGAISRWNTDAARCILGALLCVATFLGYSYAVGAALIGYK